MNMIFPNRPTLKLYCKSAENNASLLAFPFHQISPQSNEKHKQVRSDNDASELDILGYFGTFWDILRPFGTIWKTLRRVWSIETVFLVISDHFSPYSAH